MMDGTKYLFDRGLNRICLLLGDRFNVNIEREDAIMEAYQQQHISLEHLQVVYDMTNLEDIKNFVDRKIKEHDLPDVFFISGDEKAIAAYHAVYHNGLKIPDDISIIGFDNIPISQYYYPSLTTIAQNFEKLSTEMLKTIDDLVNGEEEISSVEVDPELIIRQSVK